ncbi:chitobiase/beta-hexosaminidase C-terminal domain-containing protein, partial [Brucella sp. 21LCYQ03]|nr:chitobiase/beta-hexosaminidase C-terminal domain-containing protein [Brucella sp. 21LCYQ03]
KAFDKRYAEFIDKVGSTELPKLRRFAGGFHYRLPAVGLKEKDGKLMANAEYPGFPIHYTVGTRENTSAKPFPSEGLSLKVGEKIQVFTTDVDGRKGRVSTYTQQ